MKNKTFYFGIVPLIVLMLVSSCTKNVNLELGDASGQLVIQGGIDNFSGLQTVTLSTNVPFTQANTYPPVTGAVVTINDQSGNSFGLKEGPQGTYTTDPAMGVSGNAYTLKVQVNGQSYSANSVMPFPVPIDSLSSENLVARRRLKNEKDKKEIIVYYQDPAGVSNQYRFVMWVNGVQVKDIFAYNDLLTDGRHVSRILKESDIDIYSGDTVKVEMQCIDELVFTYWYTLMKQQSQGLVSGAPAPANPPTNINPATLGYFSAYTTQAKTIIVK